MKRSNIFLLSKIAGNDVLVPIGREITDFNKMISLNEIGAFIWNCMENEISESEIVDKVLNEYDVSRERAEQDIHSFLQMLIEAECVCEG